MGRLALLLMSIVILLVAAGSGGSATGSASRDAPAWGVVWHADSRKPAHIVRLDQRTLAPQPGPRVRLHPQLVPLGRSPDGRFAGFAGFHPPRLRIVDLAGMRLHGDIRLGLGEHWRGRAAAWLTADRVVVVAQRMRGAYDQIVAERRVLVIDPLARRVIARRALAEEAALLQSASGGDKLVALFGRGDLKGGPMRLSVIDSAGSVASLEIRLGPTVGRRLPSLVVEPSGRRAFLVAAGAPVIEVDLANMQTRRRNVSGASTVFAGVGSAARRNAVWLDDRTIAVSGDDLRRVGGVETSQPTGVALLDTTSWKARLIDRTASVATAGAGTVLVSGFGIAADQGPGRTRQRVTGASLRAYDLDGNRLWQRFAGERVAANVFRDRVLVHRGFFGFHAPSPVLELSSGRKVGSVGGKGVIVSVLPDPPGGPQRSLDGLQRQPAVGVTGGAQSFRGTARDDVTRVVAVLADGGLEQLPIERGAIAYDAGSPGGAARVVQAYVGDELVSSVSLPVACGGGSGLCGTSAAGSTYAFIGELASGGTTLVRVDPRTLRARGRRLRLPESFIPQYARSPDGRFLALAARERALVRIVDLDQLRVVRTIDLGGGAGSAVRIPAWLSNDRLVAVTQRMSLPTRRYVRERTLDFVDPTSGQVVSRRRLTNKLSVSGAQTAAGRLVLTLSSSSHKGSTIDLVVAAADGSVRSRAIEVGRFHGVLNPTALAVERTGQRAFLLGSAFSRRTPPVIEIDLDTLTVQPRRLRLPAGEPRPRASLSSLSAAAVDESRIAVTGAIAATERPDGKYVPAAGIFLIDTRSWTARLVEPRAIYFHVHDGKLITYGPSSRRLEALRRTGRGSGINAYDLSGRSLYHLYGSRPFSSVAFAGSYGHVLLGPPRRKRLIFDANTGRRLGTLPALTRPIELLPPAPDD